MTLLIDGNQGIHIPQIFAQRIGRGEYNVTNLPDIDQLLPELSDPDNDLYWEMWQDLVDDCLILINGKEHVLYENQDLWALSMDDLYQSNYPD